MLMPLSSHRFRAAETIPETFQSVVAASTQLKTVVTNKRNWT
jgi:hypothetical protein